MSPRRMNPQEFQKRVDAGVREVDERVRRRRAGRVAIGPLEHGYLYAPAGTTGADWNECTRLYVVWWESSGPEREAARVALNALGCTFEPRTNYDDTRHRR